MRHDRVISVSLCLLVAACAIQGVKDGNTGAAGDGGDVATAGDGSTSAGSTGSGGGSTGGAGSGPACDTENHAGEGTYYDADGSGNCSFPATPDDLMVAAMNQQDYAESAACGACARIEGPNGVVTVRIVDRCPECAPGDVDMSPQAFERVAELAQGRVPITWRYVPCEVEGRIRYHFKDGSNQWWSAVQVRNHRHAIASFEYRAEVGEYRSVPRLNYNFFVEEAGMGPGPYAFRVTDVYGQVLEDSGVEFIEGGEVEGSGQFAPCE